MVQNCLIQWSQIVTTKSNLIHFNKLIQRLEIAQIFFNFQLETNNSVDRALVSVDQASPKPSTEALGFLYGAVMRQAQSTETSLNQLLLTPTRMCKVCLIAPKAP
jgi:hypothetical protein